MKLKPPPALPFVNTTIPTVLRASPSKNRILKSPQKPKPRRRMSLETIASHASKVSRPKSAADRDKKRKRRNRKPKVRRPEHPLSIEFTDSVAATSSHLSTTLPHTLSEKLQLALTRVSATTSRSASYLSGADEIKDRFHTLAGLSKKFEERIVTRQKFLHEKQTELNALWKEWEACVGDMVKLRDEVVAWSNGKGMGGKEDPFKIEDDDEGGGGGGGKKDEEWERWCEEVKGVGRKWMEIMEESEKKFSEEAKKKRQLAVAAML